MRRFINFVVQDALPELEPGDTGTTLNSPICLPATNDTGLSPAEKVSSFEAEPPLSPNRKTATSPLQSTYGSFDTATISSQLLHPSVSHSPVTDASTDSAVKITHQQECEPPLTDAQVACETLTYSSDNPKETRMPSQSQSQSQSQSKSQTEVANDKPVPQTPAEVQLRALVHVMTEFSRGTQVEESNDSTTAVSPAPTTPTVPATTPLASSTAVVSALRELAEVMVWADQHQHSLWDIFMECTVMPLLVRCLHASLIESHMALTKQTPLQSPIYANDAVKKHATGGEVAPASATSPGQELDVPSPDTTPLLQPGKETPRSTAESPPQSTVEFEQATVLDSSSLQAMVVIVPEPSLSAPMIPSVAMESDYETFRSSHSSPTETTLLNGSASAAAKPMDQSLASAVEVQSQVLQTLSIIVQSVSRQESLLCLFSSNHINDVLSFPFSFDNEEMLGLLMSMIKTISLKLDSNLLQLFFDPTTHSFTLYSVVIRFYNHPESMVRIAVRNITLTLCNLNYQPVLKLIASDEAKYLYNTVSLLKKLCGSVARALDLLLDDGREIRRTRSRTWLFRHKVRISDVTGKLEEIENLCAYFGDMAALSETHLRPVITRLLCSEVFGPLFRPIASHACHGALRLVQRNRWLLPTTASSKTAIKQQAALPLFDATARTLLLAFLLSCSKSSAVGHALVDELVTPASQFDNRTPFHALKALCAQPGATERVTFFALLAMEAALSCDAMTTSLITALKCDFDDEQGATDVHSDMPSPREEEPDDDMLANGAGDMQAQRNEKGELVMTLRGFDVSLTPSSSIPTTPTTPALTPGVQSAKDISFLLRGLSSSSTDYITGKLTSQTPQNLLDVLQSGTASLDKVISSVIVITRHKEVRTKRVLQTACDVLHQTGSKTHHWSAVIKATKTMLNELAISLKAMLQNKYTTIVSIEGTFDNFCQMSDAMPSSEQGHTDENEPSKQTESNMTRLTVDGTLSMVTEFQHGAGKRRRLTTDGVIPPTELEDAESLFALLQCYEHAVQKSSDSNVMSLAESVKDALDECAADDSYLDKRDALESVAEVILRHGDLS